MSEKILEAFTEKERFNIFELMLRLRVDKDSLKEVLSTLVNQDKLRVDEIHPSSPGDSPAWKGLSSRSSIRGFYGEFYMLNE
ncbi:MAG: hypothetical protein IMF11_03995 [Proteobacteria bacterium]|nr:hypothetical protein [Pseudomonadota bacterium]